jgi:hypothetical protein
MLTRDNLGYLTRCARRYGDPFTLRVLYTTYVITGDPEEARRIFRADPETFRPLAGDEARFLLGDAAFPARSTGATPHRGRCCRCQGRWRRGRHGAGAGARGVRASGRGRGPGRSAARGAGRRARAHGLALERSLHRGKLHKLWIGPGVSHPKLTLPGVEIIESTEVRSDDDNERLRPAWPTR